MNRKGITAVELLIYIVLFSIISLLIGKQFKVLVNNYSGGKRVAKQQSESRDLLAMMIREIRNTGFKVYVSGSGTSLSRNFAAGTFFTAANDSSSFKHLQGIPGDELTFYKATITSAGVLSSVDTIKYYLSGTNLMRSQGNTAKTIAENVHALQFEYGIYAVDSMLLDQTPITYNNWGTTGPATKSQQGADMLVTITGAGTGAIKNNSNFKINSDQKVTVLLTLIPQDGFPGNLDSLRVSINSPLNKILGTDKFLPQTSAMRYTFPVASASSASLCIEYWATGAGKLLLQGAEVHRSDLGSYTWTNSPTDPQKRTVRAIRVSVLTRSREKAGVKSSGSIKVVDATVSRSGEYTWRLYTETVEIPNNGVF